MINKLVIFCLFVWTANCHQRFVCPRPESTNSGIKSGPCSDENNPFEANYMDIVPGPMTIRFEETIFHREAPTIVSLNEYGKPDATCLLLDHIPHNDAAKMDLGPDCWISGYPIGRCPAQHYLTVNIPDIKCDRCFLQVISVMLDKYRPDEAPCYQENMGHNNCSTYYSCANVKIRPTSQGLNRDINSCSAEYKKNLIGQWPYRPANEYTSKVNIGSTGADGKFYHDIHMNNLAYNISLSQFTSSHKLSIYKGNDAVYEIPVASGAIRAIGVWSNLDSNTIDDLENGRLELTLRDESAGNQLEKSTLVLLQKIHEFQYYYHLGIDWGKDGWLKGNDFIGSNAPYSFVVEPNGICIPSAKYLGGFNQQDTKSAIISLSITDDRVWVRAASSNFAISTIEIKFNGDTVLRVDSTDVDSGNLVYQVYNLSPRDANSYSAVFKSTNNEEIEVTLASSVAAPLRINYKENKGEIVLIPEQTGFRYAVVAPNVAGTLSIRGPARQGHSGSLIYQIENFENGVATGTWPLDSVKSYWILASGHLYAEIVSSPAFNSDRQIHGQFPYPEFSVANFRTSVLSLEGKPTDFGVEEVNTNGLSTFFLAPSNAKLEINSLLRNVASNEVVQSLTLKRGSTTLATDANVRGESYIQLEDNSQKLEWSLDNPSADIVSALNAGELELHITTSRFNEKALIAKAPRISS
ncbi:DgyrCDS3582 [Dimorphilus gyrociliatus]|uniref:DgyrCDS3582 n=1 Tax=Dimorphilus gyrociliatus TaxID=2664684 RepID=A0A7I8VFP5_9ANNE|nr:DgyrCDS3582 [Dimorphilus gyrociliatus]